VTPKIESAYTWREGLAMAARARSNGGRPAKCRYWISFDFGLGGDYGELYEWLDEKDAEECGIGVATFRSQMSRDEIADEIKSRLGGQKRARVYIISMAEGGKFILGSRKASQWTGYAVRNHSIADES
jgi:hypothetical protein